MLIRSTCSAIVAAGLTLAMAPLACGGAQEEYPRTAQSMFPVRSSPSSQPFSGGESMRDSRAPLGIAQALGGVITLGPIILIAAG
jgi:hypothetical protein